MASKYSTLLSGIKLGDLQLKNRVALAPMTRARSGASRVPNDLNVEYYTQRANAGLVITEASHISEQGIGWVDSAGIFTQAHVEGWKKVTQSVHEAGSKIFLQLWHQGRQSHSSYHNGEPAVAPSAIKIEQPAETHVADGSKQPQEVPRALETDEIPKIVADYKRAAEMSKEAGFDGVEIHAANGYLIDQFLQAKTNHRTDGYGGSIENQYRFLGEVVTAVLEVFPANRVGVRLSPNGMFGDMGTPEYQELFTYVTEQLAKHKLAYVHYMIGLGFGFHELGEPMTLRQFRDILPEETAIIGNVGFTPETSEEAVASGDAQMIAIGRPFIANPDYVTRLENDQPLAEMAPMDTWFAPDLPERTKYSTSWGYTDFPTYEASK
eukprot:m.32733 g.32733  ORF g.32733 m.32733 type:complete len:380 (+) comp12179_c0_seq2:87-1226(+)